MILERIQKENDIKELSDDELKLLASEIREFLIEKISVTGGHLASNLGVVELTMALHLFMEFPKDKLIWDVGHQSYTHKLLTGRRDGFETLRKYGGMSGFPKRRESECDSFDTGHSSTSNNAAQLTSNFIIVLNDNNMSISENVGGLSGYLSGFRTADAYRDLKLGVMNSLNKIPVYGDRMVEHIRRAKSGIKQLFIPGMLFEELGIIYLGPVDGGDIKGILKLLREASHIDGPVMVHVITHKGAGYAPAERHPARFHGTEPFEIETGLPKHPRSTANYRDIFSTVMRKLGDRDEKVVAITAAMTDGTGLKRFHNMFPERFFDVGIAEEHAVTFAAGLAAGGLKPVFAVNSSFLQRAYDQILHDVCIQNLPVVFAIDRAGLVGSDGETHQGIFDISYLSTIPNMTVMAPKNKWELSDMLKYAVDFGTPIAVRYPRGTAYDGLKEFRAPIAYGKSEWIYRESEIALFALGSMVKTAETVRERLKELGYAASLINARFAKPLDEEALLEAAARHKLIVTLEENVINGGMGEHVLRFYEEHGGDVSVLVIAIPDVYVEHGNVDLLRKEIGIDEESVLTRVTEAYKSVEGKE